MLKKIIMALIIMTTAAMADYNLIVPQKPSGGTSVWAQIVVAEWEKHLGEKINLVYKPGARDQLGPNEFQNTLRFDDHTILVSHGGNGISYLVEPVDYNYLDWESIGQMNLNIIVGARKGADTVNGPIKFPSGSGMTPEVMAITMLLGGPDADYNKVFAEKIVWVKGMSGSERRLAFIRGDLNATRENPAAYKKHVEPIVGKGDAYTWFHHGLLDVGTGEHDKDPNFTEPTFEALYESTHGVAPSGDFYDAYKLVKSWRDALQKAFWVNTGNPNKQKLVDALNKMINDPESVAAIEQKVGKYEWRTGQQGDDAVRTLKSFITPDALRTLVDFKSQQLGYNTVYKEELTK
jgi:hypothetical protein